MTDSSGDLGENSTNIAGVSRSFPDSSASSRGDLSHGEIVTARGTTDGLVLRLDNTVSLEKVRIALFDFMNSRKHFVEGNEIILEWLAEKPSAEFVETIQTQLTKEFGVSFKDAPLRSSNTQTASATSAQSRTRSSATTIEKESKSPSLFDGIEAIGLGGRDAKKKGVAAQVSVQRGTSASAVWDDADARIVYGTLRSGQKVETEHSVVVFGDANSGSEIVAGGDVVVLGNLRGTAHAGAYDETGGGRVIFALNLQPTQLRIGSIISRGPSAQGFAGAELARVDGNLIVVETYQAKGAPVARKH